MFGWGRVFKTREHYVFDYKPRYYDERKERLEQLKEKYSGEKINSTEEAPSITFEKNNLKNAWRKSKTSASNRKQTLLLAFIISLLFGIAAYVLDLHSLFNV